MQPFAVPRWESGCPVFVCPSKPVCALHPAFFVLPAALAAAAMAHGVLDQAQSKASAVRETLGKNSILKLLKTA